MRMRERTRELLLRNDAERMRRMTKMAAPRRLGRGGRKKGVCALVREGQRGPQMMGDDETGRRWRREMRAGRRAGRREKVEPDRGGSDRTSWGRRVLADQLRTRAERERDPQVNTRSSPWHQARSRRRHPPHPRPAGR